MQSTIQRLCKGDALPVDILGLNTASASLFTSRLAENLEQPCCCILPTDEHVETFAQDISFFTSTPILVYPSFEIPPYTPLAPDPTTVAARLSTLYRLQEQTGPFILLTSAEAILRRVLPKKQFNNRCELLIRDEEFDRDELINNLALAGYQQCELVQQQGDISVRGGIIDIFPPTSSEVTTPYRLDFFGDTLESIRSFDPVSQRSITEIEELIILPTSDILFPDKKLSLSFKEHFFDVAEKQKWDPKDTSTLLEQFRQQHRFPGIEFMLPLLYTSECAPDTLFDYIPDTTKFLLYDPASINQKTTLVRDRIEANYAAALLKNTPSLPPEDLFLKASELEATISPRLIGRLLYLPDPDNPIQPLTVKTGDHSLLKQEVELQRKRRGLLAPLADRIVPWQEKGATTLLACRSERQAQQMAEILKNYNLSAHLINSPVTIADVSKYNDVLLVDQPLSQGFDLVQENLHVLSATELFGEQRLQKKRQKYARSKSESPVALEELNDGDVIVHREHGVGLFQGLVNMSISGYRGDFLLLTYHNDDKLYVPVDKLHWVNKYKGLPDQQPKLDSLGSPKWQATKKKVTEAVWKVAHELLQIYGQRAIRQGHQFSPPGELYRELEESFPFDETIGQAQAIDDTLSDLTSEQPMDRLVCGDVGYGKTEVATRAAFKAIEDGFQVAILVPTTVLAEQHTSTFRDRFSSFPVEIACLNRFRTSKQQREISAGLKEGTIDLVVGTHRLLSKDITFSKLGLLVIDEEHRFGVSHKEKIKKIKTAVDVLTLTATPIPRTLQMSLLGIRDLSVISTPPQQRRSVKTFLAKNDSLIIREAVDREMQREGQLFFVHNRVKTIHRVAEMIHDLVPHARIGIGHGQMSGQQLEEVMVQFINHDIDILVCTTIIESGLDIPNANTIIINRADHLGLADIYQLRGRVGRSTRQAYAYLFVPSVENLTAEAKKRLRALMDNSELGGGFKLAMSDLQIRGGGNLLGVSQSGHIAAVGYDLYLELLQATVADLKKQAEQKEGDEPVISFEPEVKLQISAFLPEDYIRDTPQRYQLYRRFSAMSTGTAQELHELTEEIEDRYGPLPEEAKNVAHMIALKQMLYPLGISKLEQSPKALVFNFIDNTPVDPARLISLIDGQTRKQRAEQEFRLTPNGRFIVALSDKKDLFKSISNILPLFRGDS